uniref:Uncharacterized protein n=1 Tax=Bionectria ochroleuca TaxID=29856 RepID=A0A8H7N7G2_BIOOC
MHFKSRACGGAFWQHPNICSGRLRNINHGHSFGGWATAMRPPAALFAGVAHLVDFTDDLDRLGTKHFGLTSHDCSAWIMTRQAEPPDYSQWRAVVLLGFRKRDTR